MLLSKNFTQFFFDADLEERLRVTKLLMYSEKIASWVKANTRITPVNTSPISKRYLSNSTWQTYEDLSLRQATSFSLILNPRGSLLSCCFVKGDKSFSSTWIRSMAEKWSTLAFLQIWFYVFTYPKETSPLRRKGPGDSANYTGQCRTFHPCNPRRWGQRWRFRNRLKNDNSRPGFFGFAHTGTTCNKKGRHF